MTITESQWHAATPDTLDAMRQHLQARGDVDAVKAFVLECRRASSLTGDIMTLFDRDSVRFWAETGWSGSNRIQPDPRVGILHDVAGNPWRPMPTFDVRAAVEPRRMYDDEKEEKRCESKRIKYELLPRHWLTSTVTAIASNLRENPADAGTWAALHDALLDAGCDNEEILQHCRGLRVCPTCMGKGWIQIDSKHPFRMGCESCLTCNGTGWLPSDIPHTRNCWVLRVFDRAGGRGGGAV